MIKAAGGQWVMTEHDRRRLVHAIDRWRQLATELGRTFPGGSDAQRGASGAAREAEILLELLGARASDTQA